MWREHLLRRQEKVWRHFGGWNLQVDVSERAVAEVAS